MFEDCRQLESAVEDELFRFAHYWLLRKFQFVDAARDEFEDFVEPVVWYEEHPSLERVEACNMAFTEWVLFEWKYERGKTLLELYLERRGEILSTQTRDRLRQVAETQYFSRFKIAWKDAETGILALVDERTGKRYDVVDSSAVEVEHWNDGVLAERIARVEGTWVCVGQLHLYDVAPSIAVRSGGPGAAGAGVTGPTRADGPEAEFKDDCGAFYFDGPREEFADGCGMTHSDKPEADFVDDQGMIRWEGPGAAGADGPGALREEDLAGDLSDLPSFYLRLVRDVMGLNGRYSSTLNAYRNNEELTGVYLEDLDDADGDL